MLVACAFPYSDIPSRAANLMYREFLKDDAHKTARRMSEQLEGIPAERISIATVPNPSPPHALHDVAAAEKAAVVVVGSTHSGRAGRVVPGATAERLLHGAPCPVAVVPDGYRSLARPELRRIGVAYTNSDEGKAALAGGVEMARALNAELEVVSVVSAMLYGSPALMGGPSYDEVHDDVVAAVRDGLDTAVAGIPYGVQAKPVLLEGDPADQLVEHSAGLDLLIMGSRGYGPLRAVLAGGVSGRVVRSAHCPVIVVPRGVKAPLGELFGATATTSA